MDAKKALTQISQSFQSSDSQQGFEEALKGANQALAENKIILNKRFVLESTLGAGGMGTVYKARDLRKVEARDTNPFVATKILNNDFKDHPDAFISLQREASRSHKLSHPNIVTVHDFDRDGDTIYMTMELLQGQDLETLLAQHKDKGLGKEQALTILKDIATALSFAHKKNIIHSDLKPGNIFISDDGAKILDFGIARLALKAQEQDHFDAGKLGAITPDYASFEMINRQPPDASDDVFAAAVIAYELFTGRHPYQRKSAATAKALKLKPEPISFLSKRQWRALAKGLELTRDKRTPTIAEFIQGLTVTPKFQVFKLLSAISISVAAWFIYNQYFVPDELTLFVNQAKQKAEKCLQQKDYLCAISTAQEVLRISAQDEFAQNTLSQAQTALAAKQKNDFIQQNLADAERCYRQKDYLCAQQKAQAVLTQAPQLSAALSLRQRSDEQIELQQQILLAEDAQFNLHLNQANLCLNNKDYACATSQAQSALNIKPKHTGAETLLHNANYAKQQQQDNLTKANKILQDGQACLQKLNYSCAIAKSESALEFVPNHAKALKLKRTAMAAMDQLKKNIEIE
jgi:serine/threonine protein kinase